MDGLVLRHKDVFVSHVLSELTETDRFFFGMVNGESLGVFAYAGMTLRWDVRECTSISTLNGCGITCPGERYVKMER